MSVPGHTVDNEVAWAGYLIFHCRADAQEVIGVKAVSIGELEASRQDLLVFV